MENIQVIRTEQNAPSRTTTTSAHAAGIRGMILALVVAAMLGMQGCYSYQITMPNANSPATPKQQYSEWSFFWGIMQPVPFVPPNCFGSGINTVR